MDANSIQEYITNFDFRQTVNAAAGSRSDVRLNLGADYKRYVLDENYRATVDSLVENQVTQIWSDLTELEFLDHAELKDISALARLTNLQTLDLRGTQVTEISALASLINLRELHLSYTRIDDVSALAGLINLRELYRRSEPRWTRWSAGAEYISVEAS